MIRPNSIGDMLVIIQRFDWTSEDKACSITFRVTEMLADIAVGKLPYEEVRTFVQEQFVLRSLLPDREPNVAYARSLTFEQRQKPVLGVKFASGGVTLIDGTHRYLARYFAKEPLIVYHTVSITAALPYCTITGDISCQ